MFSAHVLCFIGKIKVLKITKLKKHPVHKCILINSFANLVHLQPDIILFIASN